MLDASVEMDDVLKLVATTLQARDPYTYEHCYRVARLAELIAGELSLSPQESQRIRIVAHLHDIGKIAISDEVLRKPGVLSHRQYQEVQTHPVVGEDVLERIPTFRGLARLVRHHHERWDGRGYPDNLWGDKIPIESRVIALADAFDAITSDRPYRARLTFEYAVQEILNNAGSQFCPDCVDAFGRIRHRLKLQVFQSNRELEQGDFFSFHDGDWFSTELCTA